MLILGIDDAGRGPVIGPMVLAGVLVEKSVEKDFIELGIRDSKTLLPKKRESLAKKINEMAIKTYKIIISVEEIDGEKGDGINLNEREAMVAAMIINKLNPSKEQVKVIIDCPSVNIKSWKEYLEKFLIGCSNLTIVCEHKADFNHVTVSAASIIAKVSRDEEIKKLKEKIGIEFGSGYPSDPNTRKFIYENYNKFKGKGVFRESWKTIKKHKSLKTQKKLF